MVTLSGIGIHSGENIQLTISPATDGIHFLNQHGKIRADLSKITQTAQATTLQSGSLKIQTIEHCMSAIYAREIVGAEIKIDGEELPILDGSALPYFDYFRGWNKGHRDVLVIPKIQWIENPDGRIQIEPDDHLSISYHVMREGRVVESCTFDFSEESYGKEIAPARTFTFLSDIQSLIKNGFVLGMQAGCGFIVNENKESVDKLKIPGIEILPSHVFDCGTYEIISDEPPRFDNEMARHKILDILGDLALTGKLVQGKITAWGTGHRENIELARSIERN